MEMETQLQPSTIVSPKTNKSASQTQVVYSSTVQLQPQCKGKQSSSNLKRIHQQSSSTPGHSSPIQRDLTNLPSYAVKAHMKAKRARTQHVNFFNIPNKLTKSVSNEIEAK